MGQIRDCSGNQDQQIAATDAGELRVLGNCLAAAGDGTAPGTQLILWPCNGKSSQKVESRIGPPGLAVRRRMGERIVRRIGGV
ncbi:ricin-type beta-trefoil lectin domain protein [Streptomyces sp. NPDC003758]|uniref:Ricin-type beta-trefoil lectin domain protein n=1 Tax=Streptomyces cynarae TaxID=2981134 RepID=A0ABY6EDJ0_9ACTN|nr:ricin-type beta-trefoil lectin domain protein [Streptomyces cynarae]UXY23301.1 ricin-type beta-trefoil lectin domain protein [Streptomyces cynarae]